jgi:hypothetical protein
MFCNHFFCGGTARVASRRPAAYSVTQTFPNGFQKVTLVCEDDMPAMVDILKPTDTVIKL